MVGGWRETKKEQLRQLLYDTALELFREKGYEATTIREITQKVGIGKGTFFNYFPSKEHVLTAWYKQINDDAFNLCKDVEYASAREAVIAVMRENLRLAFADRDLIQAKARVVPQLGLIAPHCEPNACATARQRTDS